MWHIVPGNPFCTPYRTAQIREFFRRCSGVCLVTACGDVKWVSNKSRFTLLVHACTEEETYKIFSLEIFWCPRATYLVFGGRKLKFCWKENFIVSTSTGCGISTGTHFQKSVAPEWVKLGP